MFIRGDSASSLHANFLTPSMFTIFEPHGILELCALVFSSPIVRCLVFSNALKPITGDCVSTPSFCCGLTSMNTRLYKSPWAFLIVESMR